MNLGKGFWEKLLAPERADRRPATGFVAYRLDGSAIQRNTVRDISSTGAYLITSERPSVSTLLSLTMQHEGPLELSSDRRITTLARVARADNEGIGIEFVVPADDDARRWSALVESLTALARPAEMLTFLHMVEAIRFLSRVCPHASEKFEQLFRGRLSSPKIAAAVDIARRAENLLVSDPDRERLYIDDHLAVRILEAGASADEEWLRESWAGHFAVCCRVERDNDSDLPLVSLFAQLSSAQIRVVFSACALSSKGRSSDGRVVAAPTALKIEDLASGISVRGAQIERELEILSEMDLVIKRSDDSRGLLASDKVELTPTHLALQLYCRCLGHRGTPEEFDWQ